MTEGATSTGQPIWHPILEGARADAAWEAIDAIAATVHEARWLGPDANGLAGGRAGLAVFYSYLLAVRADPSHQEAAERLLTEALEGVAQAALAPGLYSGFSGVAWTIEHLCGPILERSEDDPNEEIDEVLLEYLGRSPFPGSFDVVSGLAGIGVYCLERLPRASAERCLEQIVDRLDELSERRGAGVTWRKRKSPSRDRPAVDAADKDLELGLAHGVAGIIGLLGRLCAAGIRRERARPLLDDAVAWLRSEALGDNGMRRYPSSIGPAIVPSVAAPSWCRGDLGVAAALLVAGQSVGELEWQREAIQVARAVAMRAQHAPRDACLCHGAAGLAHLFNRLYQATGEELFRQAGVAWFDRALQLRRPGEGVAGFRTWGTDDNEPRRFVDRAGFLQGAAGIGLALLGGVSKREPCWDRALLLSTRASASPGEAEGVRGSST